MSFRFNPFSGTLDFDSAASATSWLQPVATEASLPLGSSDGDARITLDTDFVWVFDGLSSRWINSGIKSATVGTSPNANGYSFIDVNVGVNRTERRLELQPANTTNPGLISTTTQSISGNKTFTNDVIVSGDFTVNGTTTTINTTNLNVTDKNITINDGGNDASAEGSGLTIERIGTNGSLVYEDILVSKFKAGALGSEIELANVSSAQTFTNKSINADNNPITNIDNNDIKAAAAIDATKIADGTVNNTEFQYINTLTSNAQTQLDNKANLFLSNLSSPTDINQDLLLASSKTLRLPNDTYLKIRNGANSTDLGILKVDPFDRVFLGGAHWMPDTNETWDFGISGVAWRNINSALYGLYKSANGGFIGQIDVTSVTPSGLGAANSGMSFKSDIKHIYVFTSSDAAVDANPTKNVFVETGNKLAGTGDSGTVLIKTGTSAGGVRGKVSLNGLEVDVNTTKITNVVNPTSAQDAATKNYVDTAITGLSQAGDISHTSFSLANNQSTFANVTGIAFANGVVRSAEIQYSVYINATSSLYESGKIYAVQRGADWTISQSLNGDNTLVIFTVDSSGQLQYKSGNYSGFSSGTLKVRALTTSI